MLSRGASLKVVSLLVALILAYAVQGARNASVVSLFIPIEVKNPPEDKVLVKPVRRGIQVTLKGPSFLIGPVASSPPPLRVKLPDVDTDRVTVSFSAADIALPSSVEVLGIEPSQMEFVFVPVERHDVKVEGPKIGQLAQGLVLEGIEITPRFVAVRGAKADVKQMRVIEADPINLSEIDSTTEINLDLRIPNVSVTPSTRSVVAKVVVGQQPTERIFSSRPVELRLVSGIGEYEVSPSKVMVTLAGAPKALAEMEAADIVPFVRISEPFVGSKSSEKIDVAMPPGFKVVSLTPNVVQLRRVEYGSNRGAIKRK
jgi:YbbR domain-containing protein